MTSYPRQSSTGNTKDIRELVEVVTAHQNRKQEKHGGTIDTGWNRKQWNVLEGIKTSVCLTTVLSYLLEEQHTILETYSGNLESILINGHVDLMVYYQAKLWIN